MNGPAFELIICDAGSEAPECRKIIDGLRLPWLGRLLAQLSVLPLQTQAEEAFSTPCEKLLAEARGLPAGDGLIPWGAWHARQAGLATGDQAWAVITPCHWQVNTHHVSLHDPQSLQLQPDEAQALLGAMLPFFNEDGIALQMLTPDAWLARGDIFRSLATASPERLRGQAIDAWMPQDPRLRRLQSEMQMLLYTHPVNDARIARGLAPVNSFWVSGCGTLPADAPQPAEPQWVETLSQPARREDWNAWAQAWQQIDAQHCAPLHALAQQGRPVRLSLCGTRASRSLVSQRRSAWAGLAGRWRRPGIAEILSTL